MENPNRDDIRLASSVQANTASKIRGTSSIMADFNLDKHIGRGGDHATTTTEHTSRTQKARVITYLLMIVAKRESTSDSRASETFRA